MTATLAGASLLRRSLVLLAVVGVLGGAASYFWTGAPRGLVFASIAVPFALGVFSPASAIAATLTMAPLIDGIVAICSGWPLSFHNPYGLSWVEPLFLGVLAGLLLRLLVSGQHSGRLAPAPVLVVYVVVVVCALALVLAPYLVHWQRDSWSLLRLMWRSLPYADQSVVDHSLRAAFLLVAAALWFWLVGALVGRRDHAALAWTGWLAASIVVAGYGTRMWIRGEGSAAPRVESLLDDANSYGSSLVLTSFIAWAVLRAERARWKRILAAASLVASAWMLMLSGSRIAILAALGAAGAICVVRIQRRNWAAAVIALLVVAIVGSSWYWYRATGVQKPSLAGLLDEVTRPKFLVDHFRENRQAVWSAATRVFVDQPFLGAGPGLLYQKLGQYYRPDDRGWRPLHENAHNYFLQLAAETGALGLMAFGWLIWAGLRPGLAEWRTPGSWRFVLAVGGLAYLVTSVTGHPLVLSRQIVLFWGFAGLIPASFDQPNPGPPREQTRARNLGVAVVVTAFLGILLWRAGRIDCPRTAVSAAFTVGFYPREVSSSEAWRWMREAGELTLCNGTGEPVVVDLSVSVASFHEARRVEVHERGIRLMAVWVPAGPERLELTGIELGREGKSLILIPSPGPARPNDILRNGDQRFVSVRLGDPILAIRSR